MIPKHRLVLIRVYHTLNQLLHSLNKSSHQWFSFMKVSLLRCQLKCPIEPSTQPQTVVTYLQSIYSHARLCCRGSRPTLEFVGRLGANFSLDSRNLPNLQWLLEVVPTFTSSYSFKYGYHEAIKPLIILFPGTRKPLHPLLENLFNASFMLNYLHLLINRVLIIVHKRERICIKQSYSGEITTLGGIICMQCYAAGVMVLV